MNSSAQCCVCLKGPFVLSHLYRHVRNVHGFSKEDVELMKEDIKFAKFDAVPGILCEVCGKSFFSTSGWRCHMKNAHESDVPSSKAYTVTCPGCPSIFRMQIELAEHCRDQHSDKGDFTIVKQDFLSMEAFETWKHHMERKTCTRFSRTCLRLNRNGTVVTKFGLRVNRSGTAVTKYVCHFTCDEQERLDLVTRSKRDRKYCPCFLQRTEHTTGRISVVACFGHYGHQLIDPYLPTSTHHELYCDEVLEEEATESDHGYYGISNHIVTCPGCPAVFHKQIQLAEHCLEKHSDGGADFTIVRQEFTSMDDCEAWRCDMERKTSTRFTKRGTWSRIDGTITTKYGCNRARGDGDLVDPLEQRQRFRRTERIHKYCPAFFVQNERKDATIDVVACFGHYGHKLVDSSDPPSPPDQSHHDEELEQGAPPAKHSRRITPRQTRILRGHREALALYTGKENLVVELGERKWKVLSETNDDDEGCTVTLNDALCSCDTENYHCERCGACAARFTCSCQDGYPYVIPCVHAHAVATFAEQAIELIGPIRKRLADESIPQTSSAVHLDAAPLSSARSKKPPLILKPTPEEECVKPKPSPKNVGTDNLMRVYRDCQMTYAAFGEFLKTLYKDRRRMAIATVESVMTDTMSMLSEPSPVRVTNRIMRRVALLSSQAPTYPPIRSVQTVAKPLAGNTASSSTDTDVKMSFMEQECKSQAKVSEGVAASLMSRGVPMNSSESRLVVRKRAQPCLSSVRAVCSPDKQFRRESGLSEGVAATGPAVRNVPMQVAANSPLMKSTAVHPFCAVNTTSAMDQECKREDTSSEGVTTTRVLTSNGCSMDRECRSEPVSEGVPATKLLAESVPVQVVTPRPLNPPGAAQTIRPTEQDGSA